MARPELRKSIDSLMQEKNKLDQQLTTLQDRYIVAQDQLRSARGDQHGAREAKEALSNSNMNKPARRVFDQDIAIAQKIIDDVLKEIDLLEKDRVVVASKVTAIAKSIKELQNS